MKKATNGIKSFIKKKRIRREVKSHQKKIPKLPPPDENLREAVVKANQERMEAFNK